MGAWFVAEDSDAIEQGDVIFSCPLVFPSVLPYPEEELIEYDTKTYNVIVLTHSCDLMRAKSETLLVAVMYTPEELRSNKDFRTLFSSSTYLMNIREDRIPTYCMLGSCTAEHRYWPYVIVNFRQLYTLPFEPALEFATQQQPRIRLAPPFREFLSQSFAKCFMRVAIKDEDRVHIETTDSKQRAKAINYFSTLDLDERNSLLDEMP